MNLKGTLTKIFFFRFHTLVLQCACFMHNVSLYIGFIVVFFSGNKRKWFLLQKYLFLCSVLYSFV